MDASSAQPDLSPEEGTAEEDSVSHQVQPLSKSRKKSVDASQPGPSSQLWQVNLDSLELEPSTSADDGRNNKRKGVEGDAIVRKKPTLLRIIRTSSEHTDESRCAEEEMIVEQSALTAVQIREEAASLRDALEFEMIKPFQEKESADSEMSGEVDGWLEKFQSLSLADQNQALTFLIHSCDMQQIRFLKSIIEPHFQRDFLSCLPPEISMYVLSLLPPRVICRISRTCRRWQNLCDNELLWRRKCEEEYIEEMPPPTSRFGGQWFQQPGAMLMALSVDVLHHMSFEEVAEHRRQRQLLYGPCFQRSSHKALFLRQQKIQMHGDMIVTGSDDNTLKVWSIEKPVYVTEDAPHLRFTLTGHTGGVWASQVSADGKYIVSGSTDRTVRVWDSERGQQLHVLIGHTSTVRCMALVGNILVSGSRDTTLRVWDIVTGTALSVLQGHVAAVRCVQFDGRRVVSGAYDYTVKIWDAENGDCKHTLHGHTNRVYSLLIDSERDLVVSGSLDTTIRVWNMESGICLANLVGHTSLTSGMQLKGDILVSCNADSHIRFLDSGLVASSSDDGTVKLWDITKGCFVRDLIRLSTGGSGGCIWRLKATETLLVCAVGSRNGTEDTKLILLDFDASYP